MFVCRQWDHLLRKQGYDLETLEILSLPTYSSRSQIDWVIRRDKEVKRHPGNKCKRLFLFNGGFNMKYCLTTLAKSFPNLEYLMLFSGYRGSPTHAGGNDPFLHWRRNIETLIDVSPGCRAFFDISANNGQFTKLISLVLRFGNSRITLKNSAILQQLKNVPQLTTFTTDMTNLTVDDFEVLHESAPKLTSLFLQHSIGFELDRARAIDVSPSKTLKKFEMRNCGNGIDVNGLLMYISKKYFCLDEFAVISHSESMITVQPTSHDIDEGVTSAWTDFISVTGANLKTCILPAVFTLHHVLNMLLLHAINLEHLDLTINGFGMLSEFDLTEPTFQCLKKLSINTLPSMEELSALKHLKKLNELMVTCGDTANSAAPIMIDSIIDVLPKNVETLGLRVGHVFIDKKLTQSKQSSIKELKLYDVSFSEDLSDYMSHQLPRLESFVLTGWVNHRGSNTLKLPNHHLNYVEISCYNRIISGRSPSNEWLLDNQDGHSRLTLTREENTLIYSISIYSGVAWVKLSYMNIGVHDHSLRHVLRPSMDIDADIGPQKNVNFECASVQTLYFYGYLIL
jgi:hypothetical protein